MEWFASFSYPPLLTAWVLARDFLQMNTMAPMTRRSKMQVITKKVVLLLLSGGRVVRNTQSSTTAVKKNIK